MDPGIPEFFKNKTVFLTGGSGFLGTAPEDNGGKAYILADQVQARSVYWRSHLGLGEGPVLLKAQPNALQRVCLIAGDCLEPNLGISERDRKLLVSEVGVVIHGAATVRFDEVINVRATRLMLQLAKQMTKLVSFVHISTAYSNCVANDIDERFYPELLKHYSDKILALGELLGAETIDSMTSALIGAFPNTYTYTKALAEDVIRSDLPLS